MLKINTEKKKCNLILQNITKTLQNTYYKLIKQKG